MSGQEAHLQDFIKLMKVTLEACSSTKPKKNLAEWQRWQLRKRRRGSRHSGRCKGTVKASKDWGGPWGKWGSLERFHYSASKVKGEVEGVTSHGLVFFFFFFFYSEKTHPSKVNNWDFQGGLQVRLQALNAGGLGLIPGQGTSCCMP